MPFPAISQAQVFDLFIQQGSTFVLDLVIGDPAIDLTGMSARAKIRSDFGEQSEVIQIITVVETDLATGQLRLSLTAAETEDLGVSEENEDTQREENIGFWDLEIVDGASVWRVLQGTVTVSREATIEVV
jgi:hypothetical protein